MKFFRKHQKKIIAALALLLALLMIVPVLTMIVSASAVTQSEIDALKKDSAALAQQKKDLSDQLAALEGEINSAMSKKLIVEQEINVVSAQIAATAALIAKYDEQVAQEESNLADAQEREARHFEEFCQRVRAMEEQGTVSYWQVLFSAADFTDLLDRAMMISEVVAYDNAVMAALKQARVDVENAKAALESARTEQIDAKAALDAQNAELKSKQAAAAQLLRELETNHELYEGQLDRIDSQLSALDDEIAAMQAELRRQMDENPIQVNTGSGYIWPLDGCYTITSLFGSRPDPFTGLPDNHLGTDIRAGYGTPIKAARGGRVIISQYYGSYGECVVVDHLDGTTTTLYAHMSSRAVSVGQTVSQGEVLGYVGATGRAQGNHLHYEVRLNNVRVDALDYYPNLNFLYTSGGRVVPLEH